MLMEDHIRLKAGSCNVSTFHEQEAFHSNINYYLSSLPFNPHVVCNRLTLLQF